RDALAAAANVLVRRRSFGRSLYAGTIRALAESNHRAAAGLLRDALGATDAGGLSTLSAACFVPDVCLSKPLARASSARHAHITFACEVARLARGEPTGAHLASIAPKIKESHRIALCGELFVPLVRASCLPIAIAPALAVLRSAERHLGRWL